MVTYWSPLHNKAMNRSKTEVVASGRWKGSKQGIVIDKAIVLVEF